MFIAEYRQEAETLENRGDSMSAHTLMLDDTWDITLNSDGKIKTATGAYAIAQNGSNAVRLFTKDAYFDQQKGIPHFDIELGHGIAAVPILESRIRQALLQVDGISDALAVLEIQKDRILGGNAYITLTGGETAKISF